MSELKSDDEDETLISARPKMIFNSCALLCNSGGLISVNEWMNELWINE